MAASELQTRVRRWAATPVGRAMTVAVGVGAAAVLVWSLVVFRSANQREQDPPLPATLAVAAAALAFAGERSMALGRAFARPCRLPVAGSRGWFTGPLVILCLIGFGLLGVVDGDEATPAGIGIAMFLTGVVAAGLLLAWFTKPICADADEDN